MRHTVKMLSIPFGSIIVLGLATGSTSAADRLVGQVLRRGVPIANSTVFLRAARARVLPSIRHMHTPVANDSTDWNGSAKP